MVRPDLFRGGQIAAERNHVILVRINKAPFHFVRVLHGATGFKRHLRPRSARSSRPRSRLVQNPPTCHFVTMPTPKRVFMFLVRCIPVVVAVGFLAFYVTRVGVKLNEVVFSGSKSTRVLSSSKDQYLLMPEYAPSVPVPPPTPAPSPASSLAAPSLPSDAGKDGEAMLNSFLVGLFPNRAVTFSGSKSMSQPVVLSTDLLRFWTVPPKTTFHTYELPPLRELLREMTFSEPSLRVRAGGHNTGAAPSPTPTPPQPASPTSPSSPTTPGASSGPAPSPTEP